jgi:Meckel syndrome type 1 protein
MVSIAPSPSLPIVAPSLAKSLANPAQPTAPGTVATEATGLIAMAVSPAQTGGFAAFLGKADPARNGLDSGQTSGQTSSRATAASTSMPTPGAVPAPSAAPTPGLPTALALGPESGNPLPDGGKAAGAASATPIPPAPASLIEAPAIEGAAIEGSGAQPSPLPATRALPTTRTFVATTPEAPAPSPEAPMAGDAVSGPEPIRVLLDRIASVVAARTRTGAGHQANEDSDGEQALPDTGASDAPVQDGLPATLSPVAPAMVPVAPTVVALASPRPDSRTRQETGSQAGKAAPVAAQASSPVRAAGPDTGRPIPSPQQNSAPIVLTPVAAPLPSAPETPAPDLEAGSTANRPALSVQHTLAMRQAETVAGPATSQTTPQPPADPAPSNERSEGNASLPLASAQPAVSMAQPQGLAVTPAPILQGAPVALDGPAQAVPGAQVAALVDAVARAREGAMPGAVAATLAHGTFGRVSLEFRQNDDGLSVTIASSDPGFAPAVLAATRTDAGAGTNTGANTNTGSGNQNAQNPAFSGQSASGQSGQAPMGQNASNPGGHPGGSAQSARSTMASGAATDTPGADRDRETPGERGLYA